MTFLAPLLRWLDARIDARIAAADAGRKAEYRALAGAIAEARPVAANDKYQALVDAALADVRAVDGVHSASARGGAQ